MIEELIGLLEREGVAYCVIGGQGVNAYVEPRVSMDLDLVASVDDLGRIEPDLRKHFRVETFPHSIHLSLAGSGLRAQTDPR